MKILIFFIATMMFLTTYIFADSMRCNDGIVSDRDTIKTLYEKCGQPLQRKGDILLYNLGEDSLLREVVLDGNIIKKITTTSQRAQDFKGNWQVEQTNRTYTAPASNQPIVIIQQQPAKLQPVQQPSQPTQTQPTQQTQQQQQPPVQTISPEVQQMADELNEMKRQQQTQDAERQRNLRKEKAQQQYEQRNPVTRDGSAFKPYMPCNPSKPYIHCD
jgi:hypothetical protein